MDEHTGLAVADPPVGTADEPVSQAVLDIADTFVTLMRAAAQVKARFVAAAEHNVEWSAGMILRTLAVHGPMRAGAIAESLKSDPSTVSRQVAGLVKDGMIERRADPEDGRACSLVLTAKADGVLAEQDRIRGREFAAMLADWDPDELSAFAAALGRFAQDFDAAAARLLTTKTAQPKTAPSTKTHQGDARHRSPERGNA